MFRVAKLTRQRVYYIITTKESDGGSFFLCASRWFLLCMKSILCTSRSLKTLRTSKQLIVYNRCILSLLLSLSGNLHITCRLGSCNMDKEAHPNGESWLSRAERYFRVPTAMLPNIAKGKGIIQSHILPGTRSWTFVISIASTNQARPRRDAYPTALTGSIP